LAQRQYDDWLGYLDQHSPRAAQRAHAQVSSAVADLSSQPLKGRAARWPGVRELVLPRSPKVIVYRITDTEIIIAALLDLRQNLAALNPDFE
jgi:plasmid stabilization system protein ParE